ncbi:MAG: phenylpyruvate tautomerase MIF-related protein [Mariprofundaceae bacterium]|nr:phenylpyruvate tautomerase MIF-related protein [Mariprofundaceae bacterium]
MPFLSVQTNVPVDDENALIKRLSLQAAELLGKPESYVMGHLQAGASLCFAGSCDAAAYVQLKSLGLPEAQTADFSGRLCRVLQDEIGLDASRIYIEFSAPERHMWGWNGGTF